MRRVATTILVLSIFAGLVLAQANLSDELQQRLAGDGAGKIAVMVLYEGLPSYEEIAREYRFLGADEVVREQVIRVMKENAESLHFWLRQVCESPNLASQVEGFTSMWIANAVALRATPEAIREIAAQPNVAAIVLDEPIPMLFDTERAMTWGVQKINAYTLWPSNQGAGVVVAVADTGVNEHPDLQGRVVDGKNYINPGQPPRDGHGHGTHCAGTIAGNGSMGTQTGVAPQATIMAIQVLSASGSGAWSGLIQALQESVHSGAKVLSMSLGGFPDDATRNSLRGACKHAINAGVIPVIAAGNSGTSGIGSPGDSPEVITVGATDSGDKIAYFSSVGPTKEWPGLGKVTKPDVSAPGVNVTSCSHNSNGYRDMSGTSMATPHVAGVVALMCHRNPKLTAEKAREILEATATDLGTPGKDNYYGSGRVNADRAANSVATADGSRTGDFEMVVKEMSFASRVDGKGNIDITKTIQNDVLPATLTVWVQMEEAAARKGFYHVNFTLAGPNGTKTGTVKIDYDNIPTDPNLYNADYGFNVGNFEMVTGEYTGTVRSLAPNPKVQNIDVTIRGKATWPPRATD